MKLSIPFLISILLFVAGHAQSSENDSSQLDFKLRGVAELGFLGVADHRIQFSNSGTYFDYRQQGGQDVLFPSRGFL